MTKYLKMFLMDGNDGVETIEFIGVIVVAAVLIAVVAGVAGTTVTQLTTEGDSANSNTVEALNGLGNNVDGWHEIQAQS